MLKVLVWVIEFELTAATTRTLTVPRFKTCFSHRASLSSVL